MSFNPKTEYSYTTKSIAIEKFHKYKERYITRPPYQRKNVWSASKKEGLFDSLFRRYYIPKIVIREVRLDDDTTVNEIIDGSKTYHLSIPNFYPDGKYYIYTSIYSRSNDYYDNREITS